MLLDETLAMVTLQNLPEALSSFLSQHELIRPEDFVGENQTDVQSATTKVIQIVVDALTQLAGQVSGPDIIWSSASGVSTSNDFNAIGQAQTAIAPPKGIGLVKSVLDDRYYGTVNKVVVATSLKPNSVSHLMDIVTAAALEILSTLATERHWNAEQLGDWLSPRLFAAPTTVQQPFAVAANSPASAPVIASPVAVPTHWFGKPTNVLLTVVSIVAVAEFGYILNMWPNSATQGESARVTTSASLPDANPNASQYTAIPVANLSAARTPVGASRSKPTVPVVLKLKDGLRQVTGANSTESKLYQFLIDPSKEVDSVDPTKDWIGFDRIYFESNKDVLTNESLWQLSNVASILKRFPKAKVKIGGYTDSSGNPLRNLKLSKERAQAAMTSLISLGVPADHLTAVGYGALDNIASNDTEEGRALNRRVSLQVIEK
jgi:OOP family OmpA-OmpF porin